MKKTLLFTATLLTGFSFSQSFDQSNEPIIGNSTNFFLCDSFVTNYDNVTGAASTWDYSNIMGVTGIQKLATVIDPTSSSYASSYPTSVKAIAIESSVTTFYSTQSMMRESQGFVFSEPTFGDIQVVFDNDVEQTHTYPMGLGDNLVDDFDGTLNFTFQSIPQSTPCAGTIYAWVDGTGTLELPGQSYSNVVRYKMIDSAFTNVILLGDIEVIRTQYEYYDFATSNLPLFIHANIKVQSPGGGTPLTDQTLVLSKNEPLFWLGLNESELSSFVIYPNPSTGEVKINGLEGSASVTILDQSGRTLKTFDQINNGQTIQLNDLSTGTYFASINNGGTTSVQRVIIK